MKNIIADFTRKKCDTLRINGLTQWDCGRVLEVRIENMPETFEAHFGYVGLDNALVIQVQPENNIAMIPIPNIITTQHKDATCWIYYENEDYSETNKTIILHIEPRKKPADYVYTETEVLSYKALKEELESKIANAGRVKTVNGIEPDEKGDIELGFPTEEETLVMLAETDIVDIVTDANGDIFTDANGEIIVF